MSHSLPDSPVPHTGQDLDHDLVLTSIRDTGSREHEAQLELVLELRLPPLAIVIGWQSSAGDGIRLAEDTRPVRGKLQSMGHGRDSCFQCPSRLTRIVFY
jgi:hypothetical protein